MVQKVLISRKLKSIQFFSVMLIFWNICHMVLVGNDLHAIESESIYSLSYRPSGDRLINAPFSLNLNQAVHCQKNFGDPLNMENLLMSAGAMACVQLRTIPFAKFEGEHCSMAKECKNSILKNHTSNHGSEEDLNQMLREIAAKQFAKNILDQNLVDMVLLESIKGNASQFDANDLACQGRFDVNFNNDSCPANDLIIDAANDYFATCKNHLEESCFFNTKPKYTIKKNKNKKFIENPEALVTFFKERAMNESQKFMAQNDEANKRIIELVRSKKLQQHSTVEGKIHAFNLAIEVNVDSGRIDDPILALVFKNNDRESLKNNKAFLDFMKVLESLESDQAPEKLKQIKSKYVKDILGKEFCGKMPSVDSLCSQLAEITLKSSTFVKDQYTLDALAHITGFSDKDKTRVANNFGEHIDLLDLQTMINAKNCDIFNLNQAGLAHYVQSKAKHPASIFNISENRPANIVPKHDISRPASNNLSQVSTNSSSGSYTANPSTLPAIPGNSGWAISNQKGDGQGLSHEQISNNLVSKKSNAAISSVKTVKSEQDYISEIEELKKRMSELQSEYNSKKANDEIKANKLREINELENQIHELNVKKRLAEREKNSIDQDTRNTNNKSASNKTVGLPHGAKGVGSTYGSAGDYNLFGEKTVRAKNRMANNVVQENEKVEQSVNPAAPLNRATADMLLTFKNEKEIHDYIVKKNLRDPFYVEVNELYYLITPTVENGKTVYIKRKIDLRTFKFIDNRLTDEATFRQLDGDEKNKNIVFPQENPSYRDMINALQIKSKD